jgi:hypothetical protein
MTDQFEAESKVSGQGAKAGGKLAALSKGLQGVLDRVEAGDLNAARRALWKALYKMHPLGKLLSWTK